MKSIKPGRGPSMMGGVMSLAVGAFGVIWTVITISAGLGLFSLFGVIFVVVAIVQAVYHFKNATGENRYSSYDITEHGEEPDPLNERFGNNAQPPRQNSSHGGENKFCPYCGIRVEQDFEYCNKCGKKLP